MVSHSASNVNTRPLPISVGLLSRRSLIGGTIVLVIALLYVLGVPALNGVLKGENDFTVGEPFVVGGTVQITPYEGWALDPSSSELFATFTRAGASLVITGAVELTQSPEDWAENARKGIEADTENTWVIGDPQTFVTDAGDHGVSVTAHNPNTAIESWYLTTDTMSVALVGNSPDSTWTTVSPEMDAMVASIVIVEGAGE